MGVVNTRVNVVVDELPALQRLVALEFSARAEEAIDARGRFVVALPGGSVASAFFPGLARAPINWGRVELFWIDERAVPPDHPDSNYALAAKLLLRPAGIVPSRVHRMRGEVEDLEDAARRASDDFTAIAGNPAQIDLALVGVGEDGHIGSVFPSRSSAYDDSSAPIIAVYDAPKPPPRRLTMTLPVMANAARVVVAAFGTEKARIVNHAVRHAEDHSPVAELLRRAPSSMVLLDGDSH